MDSARIRHEAEQLGATLRDVMPMVATVRDAMLENDYTREEAVEGSYRVLGKLVDVAFEAPQDDSEEWQA